MAEAEIVALAERVSEASDEEVHLHAEPPTEMEEEEYHSGSSYDEDDPSDDDSFFNQHSKIPKGNGTKLGDIKKISDNLVDPEYVDFLHYIMFGVFINPKHRIKHIKEFSGFEFKRDSPRYEKTKFNMIHTTGNGIKNLCEILDLLRTGTRRELSMRVLEFLMNPSEEATKTGQQRLRKEATLRAKRRRLGKCDPEEEPTPPHPCLLIPEILNNIFGYLDTTNKCRMTRVCTIWRDALYRPHLWRHAVAVWYPFRPNPTLMPSLIQRQFRRIRMKEVVDNRIAFVMDTSDFTRINLSRWWRMNDSKVIRILEQLPELRSLSLRGTNVNTELMRYLANEVVTLKELDLRDGDQITDYSIEALMSRPDELDVEDDWLDLESLSLHNPRYISGSSVRAVQSRMISLNRLVLRGCFIKGEDLQCVAFLDDLVELDLAENQYELNETGFMYLTIGTAQLVKLVLAKCQLKTEPSMLRSLASIPTLRTLNLLDCRTVTSVGLVNLAEGGSKLETLILSGCHQVGNAGVAGLAKMTSLRELNVAACPLVTAVGLCALDEQRKTGPDDAGLQVTGCERIYGLVRSHLDEGRFSLVSLKVEEPVVKYDYLNDDQFKDNDWMVDKMFRRSNFENIHEMRNHVVFRMGGPIAL